jgi:hypothetical protein
MKSFSTNWKVVFGLIIAIVILPLLVYWLKFGSFELSADFNTWVDFSTYWSPFLIAALTIILAYISWQSLELMMLKEKPVLVIEEYPEFRGEENSGIPTFFYRIKNLGEGPAVNMRLFIKVSETLISYDLFLIKKYLINDYDKIHDIHGFHYMVHSFSLSSKDELKINWQFNVEVLALVFEDLHGNVNTLELKDKVTTMQESDTVKIDKFGNNGNVRIFSDGNEYDGKRLPKRVFTLEECYTR